MTDGSPLAVRELGDGPLLVLIDGYAASKEDWDPAFLEALAAGSRLICPDNRGIGGSPPATGELSVASMAADVLAVLDRLGLARADLAGWSMGGFVAQQVAASAPERVRRLVLLSTDPGGARSVTAAPEVWARLIDHGGTPRQQASRLLALLFPPPVAEQVDADFGDLVADARRLLSAASLSAQEAAMDRWHAEPEDERLAAITAPTFLAAGTQDVVIPPANSRRLADALPDAELELYEGGGHAFMAQEPRRLAAAMSGFLGRGG